MMNTIDFNGHPLYYRKTGVGQAILLLHGFAEDGEIWSQQAGALQDNYQLIIPDLPGSGRSGRPDDVSMEALAEAVKAIIVAENIRQPILIGHSMGGYVALAFAEKYPDSLTAIGLFHSTAYADSDEKKAARRKNIEFIQKHGSEAFLKQSTAGLFGEAFKNAHPEIIDQLIEKFKSFDPLSLAAYQEAMMFRPDRTEVLRNFIKPVLFIIGQHDTAIPFADSLKLSHIPELAFIHILETSGHMGMLEETSKSNVALLDFVRHVNERTTAAIGISKQD